MVVEITGTNEEDAELDVMPRPDRSTADIDHLPEDVSRYLGQAMRAMDAGLPDSAAVQLRRTLEAAAAHAGVTSGTLVGRIQRLITDGLVTKGFGQALHYIREVGNVGAHAGDREVDEETARSALEFTVQLLRNLFEIPGELERIRMSEPIRPGAPHPRAE